jgi:excisionase family DNA binding protein
MGTHMNLPVDSDHHHENPRERYVTAVEAANFLRLSPRTVQRLAREGRIPAHPLGDGKRKTWRFLLSELDEDLRSRINSACRPCHPQGGKKLQ